MVDYSKWDKMAVDDSESDDGQPEVSSFDGPQSVSWGPDGVTVRPQDILRPEKPAPARTPSLPAPAAPAAPLAAPSAEERARKAGGLVADRYLWAQSSEEVTLHVFVAEGTGAKDLTLEVTEFRLAIGRRGGADVLSGAWEFPIAPEEDPDWEVTEISGRRAVRLTVRKKPPMLDGMRVWWSRILKGEPSIDVSKIEGRGKSDPQAFQKAWEEAHAQFKDKVKQREKITIED